MDGSIAYGAAEKAPYQGKEKLNATGRGIARSSKRSLTMIDTLANLVDILLKHAIDTRARFRLAVRLRPFSGLTSFVAALDPITAL